jgi:hypothetical protein
MAYGAECRSKIPGESCLERGGRGDCDTELWARNDDEGFAFVAGARGCPSLFLQPGRIPRVGSGFFEARMPSEKHEIQIAGRAVALLGDYQFCFRSILVR